MKVKLYGDNKCVIKSIKHNNKKYRFEFEIIDGIVSTKLYRKHLCFNKFVFFCCSPIELTRDEFCMNLNEMVSVIKNVISKYELEFGKEKFEKNKILKYDGII